MEHVDKIYENESLENENFFNVFELGEAEEVLRERISKNDGLVRIFVHPYFENTTPNQEQNNKTLLIDNTVRKLLHKYEKEVPPIFFMEEQKQIDYLKRLSPVANNVVYVIPTYEASPEPKFTPTESEPSEQPDKKENWEKLIEKLHSLGIKKIIIGGMFFDVNIREYYPRQGASLERIDLELLNCMGTTVKILSKEFDIEISNFSFPHGRKEYKEAIEKIRKFNERKG